jgi:hypothetical protein
MVRLRRARGCFWRGLPDGAYASANHIKDTRNASFPAAATVAIYPAITQRPGLAKHEMLTTLLQSDDSRKMRESSDFRNETVAAKRNITVAIEPALLKSARAVAASRGTSVSALLASQLRDLVAQDSQYKAAKRRAASLLAMPLPLGGTPLSREALHERRRLR